MTTNHSHSKQSCNTPTLNTARRAILVALMGFLAALPAFSQSGDASELHLAVISHTWDAERAIHVAFAVPDDELAASVTAFHQSATASYVGMIQQAGVCYEGDIACDWDALLLVDDLSGNPMLVVAPLRGWADSTLQDIVVTQLHADDDGLADLIVLRSYNAAENRLYFGSW